MSHANECQITLSHDEIYTQKMTHFNVNFNEKPLFKRRFVLHDVTTSYITHVKYKEIYIGYITLETSGVM